MLDSLDVRKVHLKNCPTAQKGQFKVESSTQDKVWKQSWIPTGGLVMQLLTSWNFKQHKHVGAVLPIEDKWRR